MWWHAHEGMGWWMLFGGVLWILFWASVIYLIVSVVAPRERHDHESRVCRHRAAAAAEPILK